ECEFGDVAVLVKDTCSPISCNESHYIGLEHIEQESLRLTSIGKSTDVTSNKFRFKKNDILFGKLRPYYRKVVKPNFDGICSTDIWVVRAKKDIEQNFLYYFIANWDFVNIANGGEAGTRMPRADWNFVKKTVWEFPPLSEQRAIASVLSSLDDKIDLLHRQNATLEKMAETLFRQWFVEEAKEEWEETILYDVIELVGGGTPKTSVYEYWNGDICWLSGGDIATNHKSFVSASEKNITELGLKNSSARLLPQFSTLISARGTVGKFCMLSKPMAFSQSNYGIKPKYQDCYFFTYLLINHSVAELQSAAYGSVFDTITTNTFKSYTINLPDFNYIKEFDNFVNPYFLRMKANQEQIRTLTTLRDTLLPKLMSGEVKIKI
ncbi:MAG: restriction endonuclease subunit S, partial [Prevotellaceae bacterium]|nr:restriction endonuclease subunit S [Prevotellaceae bacterium]